jgi:hypothetical protein
MNELPGLIGIFLGVAAGLGLMGWLTWTGAKWWLNQRRNMRPELRRLLDRASVGIVAGSIFVSNIGAALLMALLGKDVHFKEHAPVMFLVYLGAAVWGLWPLVWLVWRKKHGHHHSTEEL